MALVFAPRHARCIANALAPSAWVTTGFHVVLHRLMGDVLDAPLAFTTQAPSLKGAMQHGACHGLRFGEVAAAAVCGVSFGVHLVAPGYAQTRMPVAGAWRYVVCGTLGRTLHDLGSSLLELAHRGNHRRLQLGALAAITVLSIATEPTRLSAAVLWAVMPGCGAAVGAAVGACLWLAYAPGAAGKSTEPRPVRRATAA